MVSLLQTVVTLAHEMFEQHLQELFRTVKSRLGCV
jgi:hypothetical protein